MKEFSQKNSFFCNLRSSDDLLVPRVHQTTFGLKSIRYEGAVNVNCKCAYCKFVNVNCKCAYCKFVNDTDVFLKATKFDEDKLNGF